MAEVWEVNPEILTQLDDQLEDPTAITVEGIEGPAAEQRSIFSLDLGERNRTGDRVPFVLTCVSWTETGRYIVFWANPKDISWQIGQRAVEQKMKSGTVTHYWRDRERNTFFDEPVLGFTFQSGNIHPIRIAPRDENGNRRRFPNREVPESEWQLLIPPGLDNFYEFLALMDEAKVLADGRPNYVYITYNSIIFPHLTLVGFFKPEGLSFTESPDNGAVVEWASTFDVRFTQPQINDPNQLRSTFLNTVPRRPPNYHPQRR